MIGEFFIIKSRISKLVKSNFGHKKEDILDLGCGDNPYYHKYVNGKLLCFDIRKTRTSNVVGNANSLPFKNGSFDSVISINSFYYFENPFDSSKEVGRVLRKGGKFFLIMPFMYPIHDAPHDKYRFTEFGIKEILKRNFTIKELKAIGGIFNLKAVFFHSIIKGLKFMLPKWLIFLSIPLIIVLYLFYILAQLFSLLDFLDRTGRWPTYYFVVAIKK